MAALRGRLRAALPAAMKARDQVAVAALRSALAALDNAEAVDPSTGPGSDPLGVVGLGAGEVARRELSEAEVEDLVRGELDERLAAAEVYEARGLGAEARRLRAEAAVLAAHLGA